METKTLEEIYKKLEDKRDLEDKEFNKGGKDWDCGYHWGVAKGIQIALNMIYREMNNR